MAAGHSELGFYRFYRTLGCPSTVAMVTHDVNFTSSGLDWPASRRRVTAYLCRALGITGNRWLLPEQNRPFKLSAILCLHGHFVCNQLIIAEIK